ncbi:alpha/beta-hydrolase [Ramicandelaber brevisporus]|nr:alpha/beta-hydrolase [Ramicandelaber brevisporus]
MRISITSVAVLTILVAVIIAEPDIIQHSKRQTRATSPELRRELTTAFQYSTAAVLPQLPGAPLECVVCDPIFLPQSRVLATFLSIIPSARGHVSRDDLNKRVILGFSGTTDPVAALQDLDTYQQVWPTDIKGSKVHRGFLTSYMSVINQFLPPLEEAMAGECKGYQVSVVGHSLGGAQAVLAAVDLKRRHPDWNIKVFPSGKPRVGNEAWARYVNSINLPIHRLVAKRDPAPLLLSREMGFVHETGETWITPNGDWVQCKSFENSVGEDETCSNSMPVLLTGITDHVFSYPGSFGNPKR